MMKKVGYILFAALFAMSAGCATTSGTTVTQAESTDDGIIKQKIEFKDLSEEMQNAILHGG